MGYEHREDSQQMDFRNDPKLRCNRCRGRGRIAVEITHHGERNEYFTERCPDCGGSGRK